MQRRLAESGPTRGKIASRGTPRAAGKFPGFTRHAAAAAVLLALGLLAYANAWDAPFVFDGVEHLAENARLHRPATWVQALGYSPRPVAYLTFALNFWLGGPGVFGFHLVNRAIHVAASVVLFDLVRRSLSRPPLSARYASAATGIALAAAALWLVHPLQTQAVTYLYQRFESLVGLLYLVSFWAFVRSLDAPRPVRWQAASIVAAALAAGTKEVAATLPLAVLLYELLVARTPWREVVRLRGGYYLLLAAATWGVLAWLISQAAPAYEQAGMLRVEGLTPASYALAQTRVVAHYLRLIAWPDALCLDYLWLPPQTLDERLALGPYVFGWLLAFAGLAWVACRRPAAAYLGMVFLLILAPTSSVVPIADLCVEHRVYLPLAAVAVAAAVGGWEAIRAVAGNTRPAAGWYALSIAAVVVGLAVRTLARNEQYRDPLGLWLDTVQKQPANARAWNNAGVLWEARGEPPLALGHYRRAVELRPEYAEAAFNLGLALERQGDLAGAIDWYRVAATHRPRDRDVWGNLLAALAAAGRLPEAEPLLRAAAERDPNAAAVLTHWAELLAMQGALREALPAAHRATELAPDWAQAWFVYGSVLRDTGERDAARRAVLRGLELEPSNERARALLEALDAAPP